MGRANVSGIVYALAVSVSTVYAGGSFRSIGGKTRNNLAALNARSGYASAWDPNAGGIVYASAPVGFVSALAVLGSTVYVGGFFSSIGGRRGTTSPRSMPGLAMRPPGIPPPTPTSTR